MKKALPKAFVPPHEMLSLPKETPILLAFSGGADSVSLLHMLTISCKESGAPLYAAHLDHMIRKDEHERDRLFCQKTADSYGITLFTECADVPALAKESGESEELAARNARYDFFMRIMEEHSIPILVTAHNADDNLETLILNMTRGGGLRAMCGIPPTRAFGDKFIARPIISMAKDEILEYCEQNSLEYVFDSTNACADYSRNRIRLNVIKELRAINPKVSSVAMRMCNAIREDEEFLSELSEEFIRENPLPISLERLNSLKTPIRRRVIMSLANELESIHVTEIEKLCNAAKPHSSVSLPQKMRARTDGKLLYVEGDEKNSEKESFFFELHEGENRISDTLLLYVSYNDTIINKSEICVSLASDKINGKLFVRNRKSGDRILVNGMHKSVKKMMCDAKLDISLRDTLPIVCDDDGIVFIPYIATRDGIKAKKSEKMTYLTLIQG